jgi:hypothetical protein
VTRLALAALAALIAVYFWRYVRHASTPGYVDDIDWTLGDSWTWELYRRGAACC